MSDDKTTTHETFASFVAAFSNFIPEHFGCIGDLSTHNPSPAITTGGMLAIANGP